jgi:hypothetical protein
MRAHAEPWQARAECRDADPDLFFLLDGEPAAAGRFNHAELLCRSCPVVEECRAEAQKSTHGFWAHELLDPIDKARKREVVTL